MTMLTLLDVQHVLFTFHMFCYIYLAYHIYESQLTLGRGNLLSDHSLCNVLDIKHLKY